MTPGFHRITAATYHLDPCAQPSLSSSIAQILLSESPRKAWFSHPRLNPDYRQEHDGKFDLGTCAHAVLLEDDASKIVVIDPAEYPSKTGGIPAGWTNNAIRAARDTARVAGKTPILKSVYADVRNMVDEAKKFLESSEILEYWNDAESEVTVVWQEQGVWLRCRMDRLHTGRKFIGDFKSTEDAAPEPFSRLLVRMGYHIQDAFYRRAIRALGYGNPHFAFLAQSCNPPHECSLHECDQSLQQIADDEVDTAIHLWRECMTTNRWPSYGGRIHQATPPMYLIAQHEERLMAEAGDIGWKEKAA